MRISPARFDIVFSIQFFDCIVHLSMLYYRQLIHHVWKEIGSRQGGSLIFFCVGIDFPDWLACREHQQGRS